MTEYLDLEDLLEIARASVAADVAIRDDCLLESALARPRASVFGEDAYPDLHLEAAALLHFLVWNDAVVDGNKRLAWTACRTFLAINGEWIAATEDEPIDFVIESEGNSTWMKRMINYARGAVSKVDELISCLRKPPQTISWQTTDFCHEIRRRGWVRLYFLFSASTDSSSNATCEAAIPVISAWS